MTFCQKTTWKKNPSKSAVRASQYTSIQQSNQGQYSSNKSQRWQGCLTRHDENSPLPLWSSPKKRHNFNLVLTVILDFTRRTEYKVNKNKKNLRNCPHQKKPKGSWWRGDSWYVSYYGILGWIRDRKKYSR